VLECGLQTHPNLVVIAEEEQSQTNTLQDIVMNIADVICERNR
jgi:hypothetical protein